ncbi:hypothetical protein GDO86_008267 [Hymenochirus boettgeri]|uniref:AXH domain-containing protein n=1 Tax=Hymenochirus boettgeri TaxID=247094 RepID=A0A8T2J242_9PIPI|nr:hypothetical protein GDO86_008267 [Hymenochirus boettgeri]KAG8437494.1 hypothetical protein GDO86_008267 [Hymenochirus boettgeri]
MKPAHERSQECLPPKKRDLAQNSVCLEEEPKINSPCASEHPTNVASGWARGVFVAAGQGHGTSYEVTSEGGETVTVDQYGNLYKVAVPSSTFSQPGLHPVMNMNSIPSSYNVASPLISHPGITYPSIHYAPITHTSVQFLGSPYAVPYTVPHGYLPRAVISPTASLSASHVSHYVPYNSVLAEGVTSPPEAQSPQSLSKLNSTQSPSVLMGVVPVDVAKARVPVFYQHSPQLPTAYPLNEMLLTCHTNLEPSAPSHSDKERDTTITSTNGTQWIPEVSSCQATKVDVYTGNTKKHHEKGKENPVDCDVYSVLATQRTESSLLTHRSTPDTDLEVQRVVGGLASPEFCLPSVHKKDMSPLNLSHNANDQQPKSDHVHGKLLGPSFEKAPIRNMYGKQPTPIYTEKVKVIANGEPAIVKPDHTQQLFPAASHEASRSHTRPSTPSVHSCDMASDRTSPQTNTTSTQPPHSTALPSHFMRGAIIQLATGELKRVEELQTQDFVRSAELSGGLKIDSSTVVDIQESQWPGFVTLNFIVGEQQSKVCLDVPPEHPFFVYGQGWSSCNPRQTAQLFALPCHQLQVGDVCISISLQSIHKNGASTESSASTSPVISNTMEKTVLCSREIFFPEIDGEKHSELKKKGQSSHIRTLCSNPSPQSSWSNSGVQRYNVQNADNQHSPARPSFIPQEVKLSIEGRSNAGK